MARILVIDDDPGLLKMMQLMLERAGHETITASDGQEGVQTAKSEQPDLAIVDVMMPKMSGYEVCRLLREDSTTADIPLMILTARSQPVDRKMADEAGADEFLTKPVMREDLIEHIEHLLETGAMNTPAPSVDSEPAVAEPAPEVFAEMEQARQTAPSKAAPVAAGLPIIAVMPLRGGSGATTISVNIGLGTLQHGRSCIVDLSDVSGHVAVQLRLLPPTATWLNLVEAGPKPDPKLIGSSMMMHSSGVAIMAAPTSPPEQGLSASTLTHIFQVLSQGFKRIIVDLPAELNATTQTVLKMAMHTILIISDDTAILQAGKDQLEAIEALRPKGRIHIALNHPRPGGLPLMEAQQILGLPINAEFPFEANQTSAIAQGIPLVMSQPASAFSQTVLDLSRTL